MRLSGALPFLPGLLALTLGCAGAEGFSGVLSTTGGASGSGSGGFVTGTGGDPGTGGAPVDGTGGDPGTGGAVLDAGPDAPPDDGGGLVGPEVAAEATGDTAGLVTFENHCLRARWTATASVYASQAPNFIDGDPGTMWQSFAGQSGHESLLINLGGLVSINQIVLDNSAGNGTDYPRGYAVQASTDGTNFTINAATAAQGPAGAVTTISFVPVIASAVRILQTGMDIHWWSVHELRMGCQPATPPPEGAIDPFDPSHWTVTASSSIGGSGPGNAIDGDYTTRWTSGAHQQGNEWFLIDMGAPGPLAEVWLITKQTANNYPAQYVLELSTDGTQYQQAAAGMGQTVLKVKLGMPTLARYVRIKQIGQTAAQGGAWWSIDELALRP